MSKSLSTGVIFAIASAYGTAKSFSSITNAAEAVASFSADPSLAAGDWIEVSSGWGRLNNRLARVKTVSGAGPYLVTLEGVDTTDTTKYPANSGAGSVRKITTWTNLAQVKDVSTSGGEQQYTDATDLESVTGLDVPTIRSNTKMELTLFDDPTLAWYAPVVSAMNSATPAGFRMSLPNGSKLAANAYWNMQEVPNVAKNELMTVKVSISYAAVPIRYAT